MESNSNEGITTVPSSISLSRKSCDMHNLLTNQRWNQMREILFENPDAARSYDQYGRSFLSLATGYEAPRDIVESLYSAHTSAVNQQDRIDQSTPLHHACRYARPDVVNFLCGVSSSSPDHHGDLPLHVALSYRRFPVVIKYLVDADPSSIHVANNQGRTPLQHFCHIWEPELLKIRKKHGGKLCSVKDSHHYNHYLINVCEILQLLIVALVKTAADSAPEDHLLLVHEAVHLPCSISSVFLQLLMDRRPHEMSIADSDGNYPLHLALSNNQRVHDVASLELVLHHTHPDTMARANRNGWTPLDLAIRHGLRWRTGIYQKLISAFPATQHSETANRSFLHALYSPHASVEVAYEFLKLDPSVLHRTNH